MTRAPRPLPSSPARRVTIRASNSIWSKAPPAQSAGLSLGDKLFGFKNSEVLTSNVALRGIASKPAIAYGVTPTTNVTNNFAVDSTNNRFVVTVDGVKGTVVIPTDSAYSVESFANALEKGINSLANNTDGVPQSVNGVKVSYDYAKSRFVFTSGTTSTDSYIKISGSSNWGLEQVEAGRGETATWIKPTQHKELVGGQLVPKYIDGNGVETTNGDGFTVLPAWSPIYLDKGELTFDTGGKLVSPQGGTQLETVYLAGGKGAIDDQHRLLGLDPTNLALRGVVTVARRCP